MILQAYALEFDYHADIHSAPYPLNLEIVADTRFILESYIIVLYLLSSSSTLLSTHSHEHTSFMDMYHKLLNL